MSGCGYTVTETFKQYTNIVLKLFLLITQDKDDSGVGEGLRDKALKCQSLLNPSEKQLAKLLMGDLYMLVDEDLYEKTPIAEQIILQNAINECILKGDWINVLIKLKMDCGFQKRRIAYLRGCAWQGLGVVEISDRFFELASKWEPVSSTSSEAQEDILLTAAGTVYIPGQSPFYCHVCGRNPCCCHLIGL